jgi:hypothetical protein
LGDSAVAKDVTARIEVLRLDGSTVQDTVGQWIDEAQSISPTDHGPLVTVKRVTIAPGYHPARLPVVIDMRVPEQTGWSVYEAREYVDAPHRHFPAGDYKVRVRLQGTNVAEKDADFSFTLTVDTGGLPKITQAFQ